MRVVLTQSSEESAERVTAEILAGLRAKPDLVLGLATGSTPIGVYRRLRAAREAGTADFSLVRTFNLDEYLGLNAEHPRSYRHFMREQLFEGLNIPAGQIHFPPTEGDSDGQLQARCEQFEARIVGEGGIDIQLLGLGRNGHIGFNEPGSPWSSRTRKVALCERTLNDNARFFGPGEIQPDLAVTMGIRTILEARRILLQASGEAKAPAVRAAIEGPQSIDLPASALQLHSDTTFYLDPGAGSLVSRIER